MAESVEILQQIIKQYGQKRELSPGDVLIRQGAMSDGVYYLKTGLLGVYREEDGQLFQLSSIEPGTTVGELGAITGRARTATVKATEDSTVLYVSTEDFNHALEGAPSLAAEIVCTMTDRLTNSDSIRINLGQSYHQAVDRVESLCTEKKRLEELLRLREELADMIVHDLRNPLGVIFSGLELLNRSEFVEEDREYCQSVLAAMTRSVTRMRYLVDTLLDIARLEEGVFAFQRKPISLTDLIEETVAEERHLATRSKIILILDVAPDLPSIQADRHVVQRVLTNLLDNALKFTPGGGRVQVAAKQEGDRAFVTIADTGPGIPPEERTRIFEKFTQVQGNVGRHRGSGLGLTFCQLAIEAHDGRIWVEDGPNGQGSQFIFTLPLSHEG
ncbi:MAG TPA: cyclic nucleotide-binding domain-containing protein [Chloroflexi bacterium]|nr:cyclic nucleotide-binding domain-containing protein [Chloroflexota bacterium]